MNVDLSIDVSVSVQRWALRCEDSGKHWADTVPAASVIQLSHAAPQWRSGELQDFWVQMAGGRHYKIIIYHVSEGV